MNLTKAKKYHLVSDLDQPFIIGNGCELLPRLKSIEPKFPLMVEVLTAIFNENSSKNFSLEDWLIIIPYTFVWNNNEEALAWFENLFNRLRGNPPPFRERMNSADTEGIHVVGLLRLDTPLRLFTSTDTASLGG